MGSILQFDEKRKWLQRRAGWRAGLHFAESERAHVTFVVPGTARHWQSRKCARAGRIGEDGSAEGSGANGTNRG